MPDAIDGKSKRASAASLIEAFTRQYELDREAERRGESKRVFREYLTISGLLLAALIAAFQWSELRSTDRHIAQQAETSGKQLAVMQRQLDAIERDQQPYLSVIESVSLPVYQPLNDQLGYAAWNIAYANTGKGMARSGTVNSYISLNGGPFTKSYPRVRREPVVLGETAPGNNGFFTVFSEPIVTREQFDKLKAADNGIAVLVEFVYADSLNKIHETTVCYTLAANGNVGRGLISECRDRKAK